MHRLPTAMSAPAPSRPSSQSQSQSQQRQDNSISEADWWRLTTTARPEPTANPLASTPSLSAIHAEALSVQIQKDALSSVLTATPTLEAQPVNAIATLDVRLRSLILSMSDNSRANPSPPEHQVEHAIHAASEAHKVNWQAAHSAQGTAVRGSQTAVRLTELSSMWLRASTCACQADMTRLLSAAARATVTEAGNEADYFRGTPSDYSHDSSA